MRSNVGNQFGNPLFGIDTSRGGVNRVMNPSIRYYPSDTRKETEPGASGGTDGMGTGNSLTKFAVSKTGMTKSWSINTVSGTNSSDISEKAEDGMESGKMVPAKTGEMTAANGRISTGKKTSAIENTSITDRNTTGKSTPDITADDTGFQLQFTGNSVMNGIILSELLGKPKFLQKRRW